MQFSLSGGGKNENSTGLFISLWNVLKIRNK